MSGHILAAMTAAFQDDKSMHTETYRKLHAAAREATTDPKHPAPTMLLQSDAGPVPAPVIASSPMVEPPPPQVSFEDTGEAYEAGFQAGRRQASGEPRFTERQMLAAFGDLLRQIEKRQP